MIATFSIAYTRLKQYGFPGKPIQTPYGNPTTTTTTTTDPQNTPLTAPQVTGTLPWINIGEVDGGITTTPPQFNVPTTTPPTVFTTTTATTTVPGTSEGTTTTGPYDWSPYPGSSNLHLLHTKFWPKYNDENLISHADDRIRQQGRATASLSELVNSPPHESTGFPIGASIESYQGFKTVETWIRQIHIGIPDTEGNVIVQIYNEDAEGEGQGTGAWGVMPHFGSERNIEELKVLEWETTGSSSWQIAFFFRAARSSPRVHRVDSFVHIAWHDSCVE